MDNGIDPQWCLPVHRSNRVVSLFSIYVRWMLRGNFQSVNLSSETAPPNWNPNVPLVIFLNHASWWDPLLMLFVSRCIFPGSEGYAPMDASELQKYAFLRWIGLFGVRTHSSKGARDFLKASEMVLRRPGNILWITPEARFVDVRERPVRFAPGLAHLTQRCSDAIFVPLAVEYTFGQEKLPEVYLKFGNAAPSASWGNSAACAGAELEKALACAQDLLAADVIARRKDRFDCLLSGKESISLPYDAWLRFKAWIRGSRVDLRHSTGR